MVQQWFWGLSASLQQLYQGAGDGACQSDSEGYHPGCGALDPLCMCSVNLEKSHPQCAAGRDLEGLSSLLGAGVSLSVVRLNLKAAK